MNMQATLAWPFFEPRHQTLLRQADAWLASMPAGPAPQGRPQMDAQCRRLVAGMGEAGLLAYAVPDPREPGAGIDARAICLLRDRLAQHGALFDFAFAMQGLGTAAIALDGTAAQRARYLTPAREGRHVAAFALSEAQAGSDVGALSCVARRDGDAYVLDGEKTWISNGGIADQYVVFAREPESAGTKGISAFIVDAGTPGLHISERIDVVSPHPLATLTFSACRVGGGQLLGEPGQGFKLAMRTLDIFRTSVGAAALGFSRRALHEATGHALARKMFGKTLADFQLTQAKLSQMAIQTDASALLVYRAAWARDAGLGSSRDAAMAKLAATEHAQQVVDAALQMHGGLGVRTGHIMEQLYRDVRALRIYEGATEVQHLIIGRDLLRDARERSAPPASLSISQSPNRAAINQEQP
ncbi:acyl-CoA dehydrogenase family protein [Achromobacter insolitus]|uniref:acyl-CoA dehydrogenase family protein n=2 Tax=Achromobacter insolitus TaxID=217204 RepID=UPI000972E970|nr:acyl-CoA dehydrogenase family protein [Achromobacter insolitus]APX76869.1 acyl-CoA dehydrogenase [Achromobacter insolitus]OWT65017.1 acyl-CoA dehydrogenase [Achromobacter insolitus]WKK16679.1 acyl-CoA dehydrogenase family protein [Achromobacter insolitus]CAB3721939.1 Acyl-CoA dehydrogenase [Achromobacter insolitus]VEG71409.1 Acyl-CoA dehydrogenase, short-chain specific [Achromobacter insolitus]